MLITGEKQIRFPIEGNVPLPLDADIKVSFTHNAPATLSKVVIDQTQSHVPVPKG